MKLVAGVNVDRVYTLGELLEMHAAGRYRNVVLNGYVCQTDVVDATIRLVPWEESTFAMTKGDKPFPIVPYDREAMRQDVEREHPINKRTPQKKREAVANRMKADPVLAEWVIRDIQAESWKRGQMVTGEDIEAAAAKMLSNAEVDNKEADSHRVTRQHKT